MKTWSKVANHIRTLIERGALKDGDRVPSLRELSTQLNVSVNSVRTAYWKLEDDKIIKAIPQSGYYVCPTTFNGFDRHDLRAADLDPTKLDLARVHAKLSAAHRNTGGGLDLGVALIGKEYMPLDWLRQAWQKTVQNSLNVNFDYMTPPGHPPLREQIAIQSLSSQTNLDPERIIITNGCHEAVFLALSVATKPGDVVALASPAYFSFISLLHRLGLKIIEIPGNDSTGMDLSVLQFVLDEEPVKAVLAIPNFNNPTGALMDDQSKLALVQMVSQKGIPLIEDDVYGDMAHGPRPRTCKRYDKDGSVILCSSFSKSVAPGIRIGYVEGGRWHEEIATLKSVVNISSSSLTQVAMASFLKEKSFERHLRSLRHHLKENMALVRQCILTHFPSGTQVTKPDGGYLLWITLPDSDYNTYDLYNRAVEQNILFAPGGLFSQKPRVNHKLRINAAHWNGKIERAIRTLATLV